MAQKIIAIVGATGAQGLPVIKHLLESKDGQTSPYKIRALTRDLEHARSKELAAAGVELVEGTYSDKKALEKLLDGVYGAFVNTDSFSSTPADELIAAFNLWEIANRKKVRHFVWSGLDYAPKVYNWDPKYDAVHYVTKGRFGEFLKAQSSNENGTIWSILSTGPYLDMMELVFAPVNVRTDGTRVFTSPMGTTSRLPLVALEDIGWWSRHIFDTPQSSSGRDILLASELATFPEIVKTFTKVTGLKAEYVDSSVDEYFSLFDGRESEFIKGYPGWSWEDNFRATWAIWRDGGVKRDMKWIASVHEPTTLEKWMRENKYTGQVNPALLKTMKRTVQLNTEKSALL